MSALVAEVRQMTGAGTADWSDDQVQRLLDRTRMDLWRYPVAGLALQEPGSVTYRRFDIPGPLESGTALVLTEPAGGTIGTATYSVDYDTGIVEFAASRSDEVYVTGRRFDVYRAAADLLDQWAGALSVNSWGLTQDQQTLARAERITSMRTASAALRRQAWSRKARLARVDG